MSRYWGQPVTPEPAQASNDSYILLSNDSSGYPTIHDLPPELLGAIFESVLSPLITSRHSARSQLQNFRLVCRWWNEAIVSAPTLWRSINSDDWPQWVVHSLRRSGSTPLSVTCAVWTPKNAAYERTLRLLLPHINRWETFNYVHREWSPNVEAVLAAPAPNLVRLRLSGKHEGNIVRRGIVFQDFCPRLEYLSLSRFFVDWTSSLFRSGSLTTLALYHIELALDLTLPQLCDVLSHCPRLRRLALCGKRLHDSHKLVANAVDLPNLELATLDLPVVDLKAIFQYINIPHQARLFIQMSPAYRPAHETRSFFEQLAIRSLTAPSSDANKPVLYLGEKLVARYPGGLEIRSADPTIPGENNDILLDAFAEVVEHHGLQLHIGSTSSAKKRLSSMDRTAWARRLACVTSLRLECDSSVGDTLRLLLTASSTSSHPSGWLFPRLEHIEIKLKPVAMWSDLSEGLVKELVEARCTDGGAAHTETGLRPALLLFSAPSTEMAPSWIVDLTKANPMVVLRTERGQELSRPESAVPFGTFQ